MKMRKGRIFILIGIICVTVIFIWSNSLQSSSESQARSLQFLSMMKPILEPIVGVGNVTDHLIRKLAHFVEYGVLGSELALLLISIRKIRLQSIANCLFGGMAVALVDETIQIFNGRGSQVQDVWLDFAGVVSGMLIVLLIDGITAKIRKAKAKRTPAA
jgi:VanZ family protein